MYCRAEGLTEAAAWWLVRLAPVQRKFPFVCVYMYYMYMYINIHLHVSVCAVRGRQPIRGFSTSESPDLFSLIILMFLMTCSELPRTLTTVKSNYE